VKIVLARTPKLATQPNARDRRNTYSDLALGMVSTHSYPAIIGTADMMLKSAGIVLIGIEKIGSGHCTAIVRGTISDVRLAVAAGVDTAKEFEQYVSSTVMARPFPNLDVILPISRQVAYFDEDTQQNQLADASVGLVETRGFPALVGACDAMLKASDVFLAGYEKIGDGLCTAIVRGKVANVAYAVEAGMQAAEAIGEFHSLMVIPRPLRDLEQTLPVASCWLTEKPKPIRIPLSIPVTQEEQELVELPDLRALPQPLSIEE
jgi:carbon dioxide concentrating mechanism protein CcmO